MTDYSTANITLHGCSDFKLERYTADNANALSFEAKHPGGPAFLITIFDLPAEKARAIAELFGVEPTYCTKKKVAA